MSTVCIATCYDDLQFERLCSSVAHKDFDIYLARNEYSVVSAYSDTLTVDELRGALITLLSTRVMLYGLFGKES